MTGRFVSIAEARVATGLRMACLRGIASPWTEAAKGIFFCKGLECQYAAQSAADPDNAIAGWAGDSTVPVVAYNDEPLRTGWAEILILAERLAPEPALIPADPEARARMFGLAHEICGEMGLGWSYRLLMVEASVSGRDADFPKAAGERIGAKYGHFPDHVAAARDRTLELLGMFARRAAAGGFLMGDTLTALDIYWATFANLLVPLPDHELPMLPAMRRLYSASDPDILAAVTPSLLALRRRVYDEFLELPVPM